MKKLTEKLTAGVLALVLALSVAACGLTPEKQAEAAVKSTFDAIKALDFEKVAQYVGTEGAFDTDDFAQLPAGSEELLEKLFGKLQYEIIGSEQVSGGQVHVTAKITAVDMKPIVGQFMAKALEYVFANAFADPAPSDEEIEKKMMEIFNELLAPEDLTMVTNEVVINVVKTENEWELEIDAAAADAILGGMEAALAEMEDAFG